MTTFGPRDRSLVVHRRANQARMLLVSVVNHTPSTKLTNKSIDKVDQNNNRDDDDNDRTYKVCEGDCSRFLSFSTRKTNARESKEKLKTDQV